MDDPLKQAREAILRADVQIARADEQERRNAALVEWLLWLSSDVSDPHGFSGPGGARRRRSTCH